MMLALLSLLCLGAVRPQETVPLNGPGFQLGVVMNVDLQSESRFIRHFEIADGWADYIKVGTGIDQEGWKPDAGSLPLTRAKRLAQEARRRGMGMQVGLSGTPPLTDEWRALERPGAGYRYGKYGQMPKSWWPKWVEYQRAAARAIVDVYGDEAPQKVRFELFNEPYDRGEDPSVDEFLAYVIPKLTDRQGKVYGCPLDGPTLWGQITQITNQVLHLSQLMKSKPEIFGRIQRIPLNVYPPYGDELTATGQSLPQGYEGFVRQVVRSVRAETGHEPFISEMGISRVTDVDTTLLGARTNEIAGQYLVETLQRFRKLGIPAITIYQSMDGSAEDARKQSYGLADHTGRLRIDTVRLKGLGSR